MFLAKRMSHIGFIGVFAVSIAACSGEGGSKAESSQVVAKVNGGEVTVHQLNYEMAVLAARKKDLDQEKDSQVLLEKLINQELFVQKAKQLELERRPEVLQALERSKRQVLGQAYLEDIYATLAPATDAEVQKTYDDQPELFKQRKMYQLQQIVFDPAVGEDRLKDQLSKLKDLKELSDWTQREKIRATSRMLTEPSERLPLSILPMLAKAPNNSPVLISGSKVPTVFWVMGSKDMPLTLEQATPAIQKFLMSRKRGERVAQEIESMRKTAIVEYKGNFVKPDASVVNVADALPMSESEPEGDAGDSSIEKGIKGL